MMNKDEAYQIDASLLDDGVEAATLSEADTPAEKLENSMWLSMIIGILGLAYMVYFLQRTALT